MADEYRCPTCGTRLSGPNESCPYCQEARRLVMQLASEETVRLCRRCGKLLDEEDEGDLCEDCALEVKKPASAWQRQDRIAKWLYDRVEAPGPAQQAFCPHCSRLLEQATVFCPHCGRSIADSMEGQSPAEERGQTPSPAGTHEQTEPASEQSPLMTAAVEQERAENPPSAEGRATPRHSEQETPLGQQLADFGRGLWSSLHHIGQRNRGQGASFNLWVWAVLVLLIALLVMLYLWAQILLSGNVFFR